MWYVASRSLQSVLGHSSSDTLVGIIQFVYTCKIYYPTTSAALIFLNNICSTLTCVYVTGNLCNQALRVMTEHFSHFAKCLNSLAISRNA